MSELKRPVATYIVNYACDDCEGTPMSGCILQSTGQILMTSPPIYCYECPNCKKKYKLDRHYPCVDYEYKILISKISQMDYE